MNLTTGEFVVTVFIFQLLMAVAMFFLLNGVGKNLSKYATDYARRRENSAFNIGYRIFAPVVILCVGAIVAWSVDSCFDRMLLYPVIVLYWALRILAWAVIAGTRMVTLRMQLTQAVVSVGLSYWLFSAFLVERPEALIPNPSDISFEFLVLASVILLEFMSRTPVLSRTSKNVADRTEAKLHELQRLCDPLLSVSVGLI